MAIALAVLGVLYGGTSPVEAQNIASLVQKQQPAAVPSSTPSKAVKPAQAVAPLPADNAEKSSIEGLVLMDLRTGQRDAPLAGGPVIDLRMKTGGRLGAFATLFTGSSDVFNEGVTAAGGYAGPTFDFSIPQTPVYGILRVGAGAQVVGNTVRPMSGNTLFLSAEIPGTELKLTSANIGEYTFLEHGEVDQFYRGFHDIEMTRYLERSSILKLLGLQGAGCEIVKGQSPYISVFGKLPGNFNYRLGYTPAADKNEPRFRAQVIKNFSIPAPKLFPRNGKKK